MNSDPDQLMNSERNLQYAIHLMLQSQGRKQLAQDALHETDRTQLMKLASIAEKSAPVQLREKLHESFVRAFREITTA